eukprot:3938715-Rhodomonas_salina.1
MGGWRCTGWSMGIALGVGKRRDGSIKGWERERTSNFAVMLYEWLSVACARLSSVLQRSFGCRRRSFGCRREDNPPGQDRESQLKLPPCLLVVRTVVEWLVFCRRRCSESACAGAAEGRLETAKEELKVAEGKHEAAKEELKVAEGKLEAAEGKLEAAEGKLEAATDPKQQAIAQKGYDLAVQGV